VIKKCERERVDQTGAFSTGQEQGKTRGRGGEKQRKSKSIESGGLRLGRIGAARDRKMLLRNSINHKGIKRVQSQILPGHKVAILTRTIDMCKTPKS
jgi:hypothetical protein